MSDLTRIGPSTGERPPLRGVTPAGRAHDALTRTVEVLPPRPAPRERDDRQSAAPRGFSAAFFAQAAAQREGRSNDHSQSGNSVADLASMTRRAEIAYRSTVQLSVEFLGMHEPVDLRV